jgi:hypothetical protein
VLVAGGYIAGLAVLAALVPHTSDHAVETPVWLDDALGGLPDGTVVLDDMAFGAYLMWRFPQLDLVEHGYGDTFTMDELERNADLDAGRAGWVELLEETGAEYAVLPPGSALAYNLREVEHWSVVRHDADLELLAAPGG